MSEIIHLMPAVGEKSPEFKVLDAQGRTWTQQDLKGKWTVLYFYPQDDTPGCTVQAETFRDRGSGLKNTQIIGVSPDGAESHQAFITKYNLNFTLLCDPEKEAARAWGVWRMRTLYGKTSLGFVRSTFVLDPEGVVRHRWSPVKVPGHGERVQAVLEKLQKGG